MGASRGDFPNTRVRRICSARAAPRTTSTSAPNTLESLLEDRFLLFGEWLYARHSVHYRALPHYFFEFDIFDKRAAQFLDLAARMEMLEGTGIHTVPGLHRGRIERDGLQRLIGPSHFDARFDAPVTRRPDNRMEGLYCANRIG